MAPLPKVDQLSTLLICLLALPSDYSRDTNLGWGINHGRKTRVMIGTGYIQCQTQSRNLLHLAMSLQIRAKCRLAIIISFFSCEAEKKIRKDIFFFTSPVESVIDNSLEDFKQSTLKPKDIVPRESYPRKR